MTDRVNKDAIAPPTQLGTKAEASLIRKHENTISALQDLNDAILRLKQYHDQVTDNAPLDVPDKASAPLDSLSSFLNHTPGEIVSMRDFLLSITASLEGNIN